MSAKLSIHNITAITIDKEVFERSEEGTDFTVVNITATDVTGRNTRLTCFMQPGFYIDPGFVIHCGGGEEEEEAA